MMTFTLRKRRTEWGDFIVRCYVDGKRYEDGDYSTDDWQDAVNTLASMTERAQRNANAFDIDAYAHAL